MKYGPGGDCHYYGERVRISTVVKEGKIPSENGFTIYRSLERTKKRSLIAAF
jgi:hypothetical protein